MTFWYYWAKALGEKSHTNNLEADRVAIIRSLIVVVYLVSNLFIVASVVRHW